METPYRFELFGEQHNSLWAFFSCGERALDEYLKTRARREMNHRIAVVYVFYDVLGLGDICNQDCLSTYQSLFFGD